MTIELKAQLFDEIVNNTDNDDMLLLNKGTLVWHGDSFYLIDDQDGENNYTLEEALIELGYNV